MVVVLSQHSASPLFSVCTCSPALCTDTHTLSDKYPKCIVFKHALFTVRAVLPLPCAASTEGIFAAREGPEEGHEAKHPRGGCGSTEDSVWPAMPCSQLGNHSAFQLWHICSQSCLT